MVADAVRAQMQSEAAAVGAQLQSSLQEPWFAEILDKIVKASVQRHFMATSFGTGSSRSNLSQSSLSSAGSFVATNSDSVLADKDSRIMSALGDGSADMSQAARIDAAGNSALAADSTLQVLRMTKSEVTLTISADDLSILNNAMNEALEALGGDEDEYRTRMGTSRAHVERLLESVNALLQQM
jgi:hypothetical protein